MNIISNSFLEGVAKEGVEEGVAKVGAEVMAADWEAGYLVVAVLLGFEVEVEIWDSLVAQIPNRLA